MSFSFGFSFEDNEGTEAASSDSNNAKIGDGNSCETIHNIEIHSSNTTMNLLHEERVPTFDELTILLSKEFGVVRTKMGLIYRTSIASSSFSLDASPNNKNSNSYGAYSRKSTIKNSSTEVSDLIPGHYEGGLKTWECSIDLCNYLIQEKKVIAGKTVLELGCGSGLPGIFAMKYLNAKCTYFIDFNTTVIRDVTWPNICYNLYRNEGALQLPTNEPEECGVRCFAGDWVHLHSLLSQGPNNSGDSVEYKYLQQFEVIFSAETLYSSQSCRQMAELLKFLKYPGGTAYIASKRYYFGVGGGTVEFIDLLNKTTLKDRADIQQQKRAAATSASSSNNLTVTMDMDLDMGDHSAVWAVEVVTVLEDKSSNIREILKITYK